VSIISREGGVSETLLLIAVLFVVICSCGRYILYTMGYVCPVDPPSIDRVWTLDGQNVVRNRSASSPDVRAEKRNSTFSFSFILFYSQKKNKKMEN
jgi:hypothetical protein